MSTYIYNSNESCNVDSILQFLNLVHACPSHFPGGAVLEETTTSPDSQGYNNNAGLQSWIWSSLFMVPHCTYMWTHIDTTKSIGARGCYTHKCSVSGSTPCVWAPGGALPVGILGAQTQGHHGDLLILLSSFFFPQLREARHCQLRVKSAVFACVSFGCVSVHLGGMGKGWGESPGEPILLE